MTESITPKDIHAWRRWLEKNHLKEDKVIFIKYKKHTGKPLISNRDAMMEAICFGWIDTTARRIDDEKWSVCYVKRNKNSKWSNNTIIYGRELIEQGRMSPFGLKMYEEGLSKKTHDHDIPKNPDMPFMLKEHLEKKKLLNLYLRKFSPSLRRVHYRTILRARREETQKKRVGDIIRMCEKWIESSQKK